MKVIKLVLFTTLAILISINSYADYHTIKICSIETHTTTDQAYIKPCESWKSKSNCPNSGWITWDMNMKQGKAMYATALNGFTIGSKVNVLLTEGNCASYDVTTQITLIKEQ
ncbi:hypothetical protein [Spartinivicinus poritis]|uniref:Uncharacterized protein n=1 Tax=Spartinivicinus poritis TaxID=2994640 RepID=A0ABT5U5U5_9GAMM|nr:hypothetical protein [Spartinivicinus sp. A2-2]MDE1461733.1 hypothetical protein [Spartinivicinus sp. A2-2]